MKPVVSETTTPPEGSPKRILIYESEPLRHERAHVLNQQSLRLGQVLQTTLDIYDLLKHFHQELQQFILYHSFHYQNDQIQQGLTYGEKATYEYHALLNLEEISLGEIVITRKTPFSRQEVIIIENAIYHLLHPLRNAIQYHEAIVLSFTDPLTKIGNRAAFDKAIARELELAKRHQSFFSLLMIDVDNFKKINDEYGHLAGDHILITLCQLLTQLNRNTDPIFRYGGEEFIIILSHTALSGAKLVAERLRQQVEYADFLFQGYKIPVTISIGISPFQSEDFPEKILQRADKALYEAKKSGRNRFFCLE